VELESAVDRAKERVVVTRDAIVHPLLETESSHPRVEGLVLLGEVDPCASVTEVVEHDVAFGA
jgi:hypothetical protein